MQPLSETCQGRNDEIAKVFAVKKIAAELARKDYRATVLIQEIVRSYPFQYRRNAPTKLRGTP